MRLGQISVSTSTSSAGWTRSRAFRTGEGQSNGAKNRPSAPFMLRSATARPVAVVVDTNTRCAGSRSLSGATRMRAVSTSPTETAWIHTDGASPRAREARGPPMRSRKLGRYLPVPRPFQR